MDFFCVILIDRTILISATRFHALELMVIDPEKLIIGFSFYRNNQAVMLITTIVEEMNNLF